MFEGSEISNDTPDGLLLTGIKTRVPVRLPVKMRPDSGKSIPGYFSYYLILYKYKYTEYSPMCVLWSFLVQDSTKPGPIIPYFASFLWVVF